MAKNILINEIKNFENQLKKSFDWIENQRKNYFSFYYNSYDTWTHQFLKRSNPVKVLGIDRLWLAIVEEVGEFDQVQFIFYNSDTAFKTCLSSLLYRSLTMKRKLFLYSTNIKNSSLYQDLGLEVKSGFLTALISNQSKLSQALNLPKIKTLEKITELAEPSSPWFLGGLNLMSGDRI